MPASSEESAKPRVHPSAVVHPTAVLHPGVEIGAACHVGEHCVIGPRTQIRTGGIVWSHTTLGADNVVHPNAVLGGDPQDRAFDPGAPGRLVIGDRNIFREGVSISRSTVPKGADPETIAPTSIGCGNFFMTGTHAGHNSVIGDNCTLVNCAAIAGHTRLGNGVMLSAFCSVHQFCRVGDMAMFQSGAGISMHVPPYVMLAAPNNIVLGLNRVGLRRNPAFNDEDRAQIREVYGVMYRIRAGRPLLDRIRECEAMSLRSAAAKFVQFFREALEDIPPRRRGVVNPLQRRRFAGTPQPVES